MEIRASRRGLTHSRNVVAWAPGVADADGETLVSFATDQLASGRVGGIYGVALAKAATNTVPSWNFAGASWVPDGSAVLTQGQVDPTGRPWGVAIAGNSTNGLRVVGCNFLPGADARVVFWAKVASGTPSIVVDLSTAWTDQANSHGTLTGGAARTRSTSRQLQHLDASSATARVPLRRGPAR